MEPFTDHYTILGVPPDASDEIIRKTFRQLAKIYHPDVNQGQQAREHFIEISKAYTILSDPALRQAFDIERADHYANIEALRSPFSTAPTDSQMETLKRQESEIALQTIEEGAAEMTSFGTLVAARMQTVQEMLDTFTEARTWSLATHKPAPPRWRLLLYRTLKITALVLLLGVVLPWSAFKIYLHDFHPLPAFSNVQLTSPGIGVTFSAYLYGQQGNIQARFYDDGQLIDTQTVAVSTFLPTDAPSVKITSDNYTPYMIGNTGTIKLYWCLNSDCAREQLLQSLTFPVHDVSSN